MKLRIVQGRWFANSGKPINRCSRVLFVVLKTHWSPLPDGSYKANFNAAIFEDSNCAGIGVVYRDHSGHVIAALSQKVGLT